MHVEVKGSSVAVESILLTRNEVTHASEHVTTLVVVDQIEVRLGVSGDYECNAGHLRRWDSWVPQQEALTALQHAYVLPLLSTITETGRRCSRGRPGQIVDSVVAGARSKDR